MTHNIHPEAESYRRELSTYAAELLALTAESYATRGRHRTKVQQHLATAADKFLAEDLAEAIAYEAVALGLRIAHPAGVAADVVAQAIREHAQDVAQYNAQDDGAGDD